MYNVHRPAVAAVLGALSLLASREVRADAKQECAAAYDATQTLREQGKLLEARQQALACSNANCSSYVVKDCTQWASEIEASLPTVVFVVQDASGADTTAVRVSVDGHVLGEKLDGKAVPLNPGEHVIRFEMAGAGPVEQKVLIRQGDKYRNLSAAFKGDKPKDAQPSTLHEAPPSQPPGPRHDSATPSPPPSQRETNSGWRYTSYGAAGLGVLGLVVGAVSGAMVMSQHKTLVNECPDGGCSSDLHGTLESYRAKALVSTIGFIGGGALLAGGVGLYFFGPQPSATGAASGSVTPVIGLGTVGVSGSF